MRKLSFAAFVAVVSLFGAGASAHAYPIGNPVTEVASSSVSPGGSQTVTADKFCPDVTVTFVLNPGDVSLGTSKADSSGHASITFTAPSAVGDYTVVATAPATCRQAGGTDKSEASFAVTTPTPLPSTGSDSNSQLQWAFAAIGIGALLVGVAVMRRRHTAHV